MKYEYTKQIMDTYLSKQEHWLAYNEYSRMRSHSWRTTNFYYHVELPLKEDLRLFEKILKNTTKLIKKIDKKKENEGLSKYQEYLIEKADSFEKDIKNLKDIIKDTSKSLSKDLTIQEEHTALFEKVKNNFSDYLGIYDTTYLKCEQLVKMKEDTEKFIEGLEDKSLLDYLKTKVVNKKHKHKIQ